MTVHQLLADVDADPSTILRMTDDELDVHLSPLIPIARAPFVGRRSETFKSSTSGKTHSKKYLDAKTAQVIAMLEAQKASK